MRGPGDRLGVAVVGLGVGEQHARAWLDTGRCKLRWLHDLDNDRAQRLARELGDVAVANDLSAILEDENTHAVSVASWDDAHAEQTVALLRAGKHVFVEKPLCRSQAELTAIEEAWEAGGRPHLRSNLVLRGAPLYCWLRKAIAAGELGRIYAFDGDYLYGRLHKITDGWRGGVEGYSVMQGGGIHLLDLMLWTTGQVPTEVSCLGNRICTEESTFRYKDFVASRFRFESGLVGRISANFGCVHPHQHVVRVFGTEATFIQDDAGARLHRNRNPEAGSLPLDPAPLPKHKGALIPDLVDAILEERDPEQAFRHERQLVVCCLAADRALESGREAEVAA